VVDLVVADLEVLVDLAAADLEDQVAVDQVVVDRQARDVVVADRRVHSKLRLPVAARAVTPSFRPRSRPSVPSCRRRRSRTRRRSNS